MMLKGLKKLNLWFKFFIPMKDRIQGKLMTSLDNKDKLAVVEEKKTLLIKTKLRQKCILLRRSIVNIFYWEGVL